MMPAPPTATIALERRHAHHHLDPLWAISRDPGETKSPFPGVFYEGFRLAWPFRFLSSYWPLAERAESFPLDERSSCHSAWVDVVSPGPGSGGRSWATATGARRDGNLLKDAST